jgi:hypothetical protein
VSRNHTEVYGCTVAVFCHAAASVTCWGSRLHVPTSACQQVLHQASLASRSSHRKTATSSMQDLQSVSLPLITRHRLSFGFATLQQPLQIASNSSALWQLPLVLPRKRHRGSVAGVVPLHGFQGYALSRNSSVSQARSCGRAFERHSRTFRRPLSWLITLVSVKTSMLATCRWVSAARSWPSRPLCASQVDCLLRRWRCTWMDVSCEQLATRALHA